MNIISIYHSSIFVLLCFVVFSQFTTSTEALLSTSFRHSVRHNGFDSADYALVIGCDGMGSYWLQRPPSWLTTPNLDRLRKQGAYSWNARSVMPTISKPNWASIIDSAGPEEHGVLDNDWKVGTELPPITGNNTYFPSMFQAIKQQNSTFKNAVYSDWDGLFDLFPKEMADFSYLTSDPNAQDVTVRAINEIIIPKKAQLIFLHFDDVDEAGHHFGWGSQQWYQAVAIVDSCVGQLLNALEKSGILNRTFILLTADHGGEGTDHGETDMKNMPVPWFISGPGVKKGFEIPSPTKGGLNVRSMDTAATVVNTLGFSLPSLWIGRVVEEAFEGRKNILTYG